MEKIPKKIHIVWVGDEAKQPNRNIDTWRKFHPDYEVKVWGNEEFREYPWVNRKHLDHMYQYSLPGVADLMRLEILYNEGGIYVDADSIALQALHPWLHHLQLFAAYENEQVLGNQVANGFIGAVLQHPFLIQVVNQFKCNPFLVTRPHYLKRRRHKSAWKTVGPLAFTKAVEKHKPQITVLPSSFVLPTHYSDDKIDNTHEFTVCQHHWGTTTDSY
jgi:mannosyltransferase OCH1-like enzyme